MTGPIDDDYQGLSVAIPEGGWKFSMTIRTLSGRRPFWFCSHIHDTPEEAAACPERPDLT